MMSEAAFVNDARVMSKGQVTIPKNVRAALGITTGDRVTFIVEGNTVRVVNSAIYALQRFQEQMKGAGKEAGLLTDDDVAYFKEVEGVKEAEAVNTIDALAGGLTITILSEPESINMLRLKEGRMPSRKGECVTEQSFLDETFLNVLYKYLRLSK